MADQMRKRIGNPPDGVRLPVWAWHQWDGKRKRPDMRTHGYWTEKGTPIDFNAVYSKEERIKSWEKIFDYKCTFDGENYENLSTQATMWEIKAEWVIKAEHFVSR